MRFGLQKLTLLDYPGKVACTVFTSQCNLRCPFCHNADLVLAADGDLPMDKEEIIAYLRSRAKVLDGVCVTGGEPLMHTEMLDFLADIKSTGLAVKLDTNGTYPGRLKTAVGEGLVDMVAMDVKNSKAKYGITCGANSVIDKVSESVDFLLSGKVSYEFRTTVVGTCHTPEDFLDIGTWISGAERYYLQKFSDSGKVLAPDAGMAVSDEIMDKCLENVRLFVPCAKIRGQE